MNKVTFALVLTLGMTSLPSTLHALTVEEFASICTSIKGRCSASPFVQAYIGGALDLVAMLDEETPYLGEVYCTAPGELFDVPTIVDYILSNRHKEDKRNAMLLVIHYLEQRGGCLSR